jgi:hypothetical protein
MKQIEETHPHRTNVKRGRPPSSLRQGEKQEVERNRK